MSDSTPDTVMPESQRNAAAKAHLQVDKQADQAQTGTPHYGDFGKPGDAEPPTPRSGSNDNPDEFSEIRDPQDSVPRDGKTDSGDPNPHHQTGHVKQNRDPQAVRAAQGNDGSHRQEEEDTREAWEQDDQRYAGGHAQASWKERNDTEHDKND